MSAGRHINTHNIDELWLHTLQQLCDRAAHEIRGALNGVSVNVEVVRSRSERVDSPASAVVQYARAAAGQLEAVIAMTEAMLALSRTGRRPSDVAEVTRQIAALLGPVMRADGRTLALELDGGTDGGTDGRSTASLSATRLAVGAAFLVAADLPGDVMCRRRRGGPPTIDIFPTVPNAVLPHEVGVALAYAGITTKMDGHGISIVFPGFSGNTDEVA